MLGTKPIAQWDTAGLLKLMWETWNDVFKRTLGFAERSLVSELRDVRNKWAHQEPFSSDDADRALLRATIAAQGYRFRVPYGTLLCVSDKPLHGELKLPGMATDFYRTQVASHLLIGIRAMEKLREMPLERIHSRKLRSFHETAFL